MDRLNYYLIKYAVEQLTPEQRAARYPHVADLQRRMTVGPNNTAAQAQQNYIDVYTKRYNNIANPAQIGRWYASGKTDQQIYDYTHGQVMKSMERDGLQYAPTPGSSSFVSPFAPPQPAPTSYAGSTTGTTPTATPSYTSASYTPYTPATPSAPYLSRSTSTYSPSTTTPASTPTAPASGYSRSMTPTSKPSSGYTPTYSAPPSYTTTSNPDGTITRQRHFTVPGIRFTNPYYTGPTRSTAQIRAAHRDMSNQFRNTNFTWDKATGRYNWTGGAGRIDPYNASQVELARLRNIWNNMNLEERKRYQGIYNKRTAALNQFDLWRRPRFRR